MSSPRCAVVIPCFDDGGTVEAAVRSAQAQEPCELVVVDDGSRDAQTQVTLARLETEGIHIVRQENAGVSAARMTGVHATTAPYVFALDADDELLVNGLTPLADALDADPDLALAWGRFRYIGEKSHDKSVAAELDPWALTYLNDLPAAALLRRSALLAAGGWRLTLPYEDWDLWLAIAERGGRGRGLQIPVYRYRVHGVRMYRRAMGQRAELYALLRERHPSLFRERRRTRRGSRAPVVVKVAFPAIDALWPGMGHRKATLLAVLWHVANGRGGLHRPAARWFRRRRARRTAVAEEGLARG